MNLPTYLTYWFLTDYNLRFPGCLRLPTLSYMTLKTKWNDQTGFFVRIHNSCESMTDWEFFAHIGFPQRLQLRSFPLWFVKKISYILHKHLLKGLLKVLHFHFGTFVNFSPKIFYIPENVAGCKFWWVETTITRRDKVFWEKESQMRGRRGSILGWHIWRFSFLLFPLCIELKHCPFFFSFSTYIIKGGQKLKCEWNDRSVVIYWALTIICFLHVLRPYHFGEKSCKIWTFLLYTKDRKHFTAKRRFLRCQRNLGITGIFYHKTASSTTFFFIFSEA